MRSIRRSMCAAILSLQAVTLGLTTPVLIALESLSWPLATLIGLGLTVLCILAAGMLRKPTGYYLGWAIQAASLALGFLVPAMFFLGIIFGSLWAGASHLGAKIDVEKAERAALEVATPTDG